jgi:hypothetical protein
MEKVGMDLFQQELSNEKFEGSKDCEGKKKIKIHTLVR